MELHENVKLVFKNKDGDNKELKVSVKDMLENTLEDFYEWLEDDCVSSGCNNESQNFCDCGPQYENFTIHEVILQD